MESRVRRSANGRQQHGIHARRARRRSAGRPYDEERRRRSPQHRASVRASREQPEIPGNRTAAELLIFVGWVAAGGGRGIAPIGAPPGGGASRISAFLSLRVRTRGRWLTILSTSHEPLRSRIAAFKPSISATSHIEILLPTFSVTRRRIRNGFSCPEGDLCPGPRTPSANGGARC